MFFLLVKFCKFVSKNKINQDLNIVINMWAILVDVKLIFCIYI